MERRTSDLPKSFRIGASDLFLVRSTIFPSSSTNSTTAIARVSGKPPVGTWLNLPLEGSAVRIGGAVQALGVPRPRALPRGTASAARDGPWAGRAATGLSAFRRFATPTPAALWLHFATARRVALSVPNRRLL